MRSYVNTTFGGAAVCLCALLTAQATQPAGAKNESVIQLQEIGHQVASAVLRLDSRTILSFSRPDLASEEEAAVNDPDGDLHCFLFEPTCPTIGHSVYGVISRASRLELDVRVFRDAKGAEHGWILFFDAAKIDRKNLQLTRFLCRHSTEIASWLFEKLDGKWVSAHAPFDFETDTLCPPQ